MTSDPTPHDPRDEEARRWFAALNAQVVTTGALEDFHSWRRDPLNDAAYRRVESLWARSSELSGDPQIQAALESARSRPARRTASRTPWWLISGAAIATACAAMGAAYIVLGSGWSPDGSVRYRTAVGEQRTLVLRDGTRVHLDTDSAITVRLGPKDRRVSLDRGQALFDVIHQPQRPFQVAAGQTTIRDLGTRFDVRRDKGQVRVTLVAGAVEVLQPGSASAVLHLKPGEQVETGVGRPLVHPVDATAATSWTTGRLVFDDIALSAATAEVNRYAAHKIVLASPGVETTRVTGTFDAADTEGFVSAVARLYDLNVHPRADGAIVLSAASDPKPT